MSIPIRSVCMNSVMLMVCCATMQNNVSAQAPSHYEGMSYQAVARNAAGDPLLNQNISLRLQVIRQLAIAYEETRSVTTNDHGLFSVVIGEGVGTASGIWANFEDIDWSGNYTYRLAVLADLSGGTSYVPLANEIIRAVPFAHRTRYADGLQGDAWQVDTVQQFVWSGTGYHVGIGTATPTAALEVNADILVNGLTLGRGSGTQLDNTAFGEDIHSSNTSGAANTAVGARALQSNTSGGFNTAVGRQSLQQNTTGNANSSFGAGCLSANTKGAFNTAGGYECLLKNDSGHYNTGFGVSALKENIRGAFNVGIGYQALENNTSGISNVGLGSGALRSVQTGIRNAAVGRSALENTTGSGNTAVGYSTGPSLMSLSNNNTFIGTNTGINGAAAHNYSTALGEFSTVTGSDQVRIGSTLINSIGGYQPWTNLSDGRYKKNVRQDVSGLDLIMQLRPISYQIDQKRLIEQDYGLGTERGEQMLSRLAERNDQRRETGFIAQEVEAAAKELGIEFSGVDAPKNENDKYGLRYSTFVVPLVKAVQEQQAMIEELRKEVKELRANSGR